MNATVSSSTKCPGCSGQGQATDTRAVLRCEGCGGVFTQGAEAVIPERLIAFVKWHLPMLANAGPEGQFYFDFVVVAPSTNSKTRMHGWADRATRRVVQWG